MDIKWEENSEISVRVEKDGVVVLSGNKAGLLTLSRMMADLAECEVREHVHLDEENGLKEGSGGMIIEKNQWHKS